jgi:hypothetical protein
MHYLRRTAQQEEKGVKIREFYVKQSEIYRTKPMREIYIEVNMCLDVASRRRKNDSF